MSLTKTIKQSSESYLIYGDFLAVMTSPETITAYECSALDKDGASATSVVLTTGSEIVGTGDAYGRLFVRVKDGIVGKSPYHLTIKVTTSTGNKWEVDGLLVIREQ